MTAINPAAFNAAMAAIFTNGVGQAGLEVGSDPGLPAEEYIQIPQRMSKMWVAKIVTYVAPAGITPVPTQYVAGPTDSIADLSTKEGWVTNSAGNITVNDKSMWVDIGGARKEIEDFRIEPPTFEDVQAFYTVNVGHVRDAELSEEQKLWVHAVRFWSVVAGLVTSTKSREFVMVANPVTNAADAPVAAAFIRDYAENAWTAAAARATSWRKTNHCTGGDLASGFPRRWLQKMSYWVITPDKAATARGQRKSTTAFYIATHAVSVHATLALMLPEDDHHWAEIDPSVGLMPKWNIGDSARIRMSPRTQVAGAAVVVDSLVVYRMLVKEGLSPMVTNRDQLGALVAAHKTVEAEGMRCGTYARWFFDGHPDSVLPESFSQKEAAFADLVGELATVAVKYYATSTIGQSMALANASTQSSDEVAKTTWSALASAKRQASSAQVVQAVNYLKGASAAGTVASINSPDENQVKTAVSDYNDLLKADASTLGVPVAPVMDATQVWVANQRTRAAASSIGSGSTLVPPP